MFWTKRVVIGDGERGLVYQDRQFERVLAAGVYRMFDPLKRIDVVVHNIANPEYTGRDADALIARLLLPPIAAHDQMKWMLWG